MLNTEHSYSKLLKLIIKEDLIEIDLFNKVVDWLYKKKKVCINALVFKEQMKLHKRKF